MEIAQQQQVNKRYDLSTSKTVSLTAMNWHVFFFLFLLVSQKCFVSLCNGWDWLTTSMGTTSSKWLPNCNHSWLQRVNHYSSLIH